jgi:hypothetical protein
VEICVVLTEEADEDKAVPDIFAGVIRIASERGFDRDLKRLNPNTEPSSFSIESVYRRR